MLNLLWISLLSRSRANQNDCDGTDGYQVTDKWKDGFRCGLEKFYLYWIKYRARLEKNFRFKLLTVIFAFRAEVCFKPSGGYGGDVPWNVTLAFDIPIENFNANQAEAKVKNVTADNSVFVVQCSPQDCNLGTERPARVSHIPSKETERDTCLPRTHGPSRFRSLDIFIALNMALLSEIRERDV